VKLRVPSSCDLALEPQLGSLLLLEISAVVATGALQAHHIQIHGDPSPGEFDEASDARIVVTRCHQLLRAIHAYRHRVIDRLEHDHAAWFDDDDE
jgi:hypothetical protein